MHRLACLLLTAVAVLAADANQDLLDAARKGDLDTVQALIEKGAPIETKTPYGQTPLYLAAMKGHEAVVQFLLDKGASTDVTDTFYHASLLDFVMEEKHYAVAKLIVTKGNDKPDQDLKTVASSGQADLVAAVLDRAKPGQAVLDSTYEAALAEQKTAVAELLKKAGANEPAPPVAIDPKVLDSYAGTFKTEAIPLDIKVFVKEGKLYLQATGQPAFAPKAKSSSVFAMAAYNLEVEFDTPNSFTLKQGGQSFKFKKAVTQ